MNFINPYTEIYFRPQSLKTENYLPFYKEVIWIFLKNLDNRLKLFQHRLNIVFTDTEDSKKITKFGSIYEYRQRIEKPFNEIEEQEKRRKLLEIIYRAFIEVGTENKWDLSVIENAYLKSINEIGVFEYFSENKTSKNKKLSGQIKMVLKGNSLTFYALINEISSDSTRLFKLLETSEDNLSWHRMFKEFGWFDNQKFGLKLLSGELWIVLNFENGEVEEIKRPKKLELKKIEDVLNDLNKPEYNSC